jgi:hypothetical protein
VADLPVFNEQEALVIKNYLRILINENLASFDSFDLIIRAGEFGIPPMFLKLTFDKLLEKEVLRSVQNNNRPHYEINPQYQDAFFALTKSCGLFSSDYSMQDLHLLSGGVDEIPAADRFVSIADNQYEVAQAKDALSELSDAIRRTNDSLTTNPEDRLLLSKEIDTIKELIDQPRIRVAALYDVLNGKSVLKYLGEQAISTVIRQATIKALENLHILWHIVSSLL